jgi:type III secretion protein C
VGYTVVDQDVGLVVAGIAAQLGLRSDVSAHVHGRVHGRMAPTTPDVALDRLGALYGFDWYSDGRTLFASAYGEAQHRMLLLGDVSGDELLQTLASLGVADTRWPVRISPRGDIAAVDGPPRYVAAVEDTLAALSRRARTASAEVHVFRGVASGS